MMDELARKYLQHAFKDLVNYDAEDPLEPIDPLTYKTPEGDSCLHIAAARGDLEGAKLLLDAGLDVNARGDLGNTPLHYARKNGHAEMVKFLLNLGASPQVANELGERAGNA